MMILSIDTETTGLDSKKHDLIQIGALMYDTVTGTAKGYIIHHEYNSKFELNENALKVNGYYIGKWKDLSIDCDREIGATFLTKLINSADILIAHNVPFDSSFINEYINKYSTEALNKRIYWADTSFISITEKLLDETFIRIFGKLPDTIYPVSKLNLDTLIYRFDANKICTRKQEHDALEDAVLTLIVFIEYYNKTHPWKLKQIGEYEYDIVV